MAKHPLLLSALLLLLIETEIATFMINESTNQSKQTHTADKVISVSC